MEVFLVRLLQFLLSISLLVLLHEGGHLFFAKLFGIRVEKFYIFMDLGIGKWGGSLFRFKPKKSDTEYGMGWLPLGGYCKISGMIDESFDTEQMSKPAEDWEFRSKPAWQRLLVMIGGVSVNFILALFIYVMLMFSWGETYVQTKDMKQGFVFNEEAKSYGFKDHDVLLGTENGTFKDFGAKMYREISKAKRVDVMRDGKKVSINLTGELNLLDMIKTTPAFCLPYVPANVDSVMAGGPAAKAGIKKGDKIVALNGKKVTSSNQFTNELSILGDVLAAAKSHADSVKVRTVTVGVIANGADSAVAKKMLLTPDLKLAIGFPAINTLYTPFHKSYGFLESIPAGIKYGWDILHGYVSDMKYVFSADGAKSLGGFGAIGSMFPSTWDWYVFWKMTAFLSIILAFMNILPIPALDGGHVLFLIYEIVTGRKLGEKFMIRAEYIGISILILLMVVANLNDILRWLGYMH